MINALIYLNSVLLGINNESPSRQTPKLILKTDDGLDEMDDKLNTDLKIKAKVIRLR